MGSPIEGVIFDLGGVLVERNNAVTYRYIEREYDIDFDMTKKELEKKLPLVQMGMLSEGEWLGEFFKSLGIDPPEGFDEIWGARAHISLRRERRIVTAHASVSVFTP